MRAALWTALALLALQMAKAAGGGAAAVSSDEELRSRSGNSGSKERARKKRAKAARTEGSSASASEGAPPWLSAALDAQTQKVTASIRADLGGTLAMITDNLNVITMTQKESDRKIDLLAQQQSNFETTQAKFQLELQLLKSSRSAASSAGGSNGSTAAPEAGTGGNPYSNRFEPPRELDKARFIVGGWKNSLGAVVERQVKEVIATMAEKPKLELLDIGGSRSDYCFVKFLPQPGLSALQLGNAFKTFLYEKKIPATGNVTKVLWAQPNRSLEARTWRKSINSVRRFLHTIREGAGMALNYVEHDITTEVISGDYRATKRHVAWKGEVVCTFPAEGEVCWKPAAELAIAFAGIEGFAIEAFLKAWQTFTAENNINNMEI